MKMEDRRCKCHNVVMVRYQNIRYSKDKKQKPYYLRCRVKFNKWQREKRIKNPSLIRSYEIRKKFKKYGITEKDYERIFIEQKGLCKICRKHPDTRWKKLAVDHDHKTNKIRGLLCMTCNTMLGRLEKRFEKTMEYLGVRYEL